MPTRRDFLHSALLLPAALASPSHAQDNKTGSIVFADFESGNYEGWTIEGDAFGNAPAAINAPFLAKVRGYTGRGFVCSFHPRKGDAATGKMISKEFTIDKPFLTFKIGGGNHPHNIAGNVGQACLNLIVEGKTVRTTTGDGSANLSDASWDVSEFVGRKAHIEIVDATASADRGYIMVDDIGFASYPTDPRVLDIESGPTLKRLGLQPFFFTNSTVKFSQQWGNGDFAPIFDFGITPQIFKSLVDSVCVRAYQLQHDPARPLKQTVNLLVKSAEDELA